MRIQPYFYLKKSNSTNPIGQTTKLIIKINSNIKRARKRKTSAIITNVFTNIPIAIEKPTKPFLYSFFQGLKKVFTRRGKENNCIKALLREAKKEIKPSGASKYQNFRKINGSPK